MDDVDQVRTLFAELRAMQRREHDIQRELAEARERLGEDRYRAALDASPYGPTK